MTIFKIKYTKLGGHYHCRVFSGQHPNQTFAKMGDLCVAEDEWAEFRDHFQRSEIVPDNKLVLPI